MNKTADFIKQVFISKSIYRILFNWQVLEHCRDLKGICLDLAGGINPSYQRYWSFDQSAKLINTDYNKNKKPDLEVDFNQCLPFEDGYADNIFLFNAIYIVRNPKNFFKEVFRVLKPNGKFYFSSPFILNEAREPDDFRRYTSEGIEMLLKETGCNNFQIIPFGNRFTAACFILNDFFLFNFIRFIFYSLAVLFDRLVPKKLNQLHPCPLGYFIITSK